MDKHRHRNFYSEDFDPIPKTIKQYRKLPNGKTQWFINYVRICLETVEPIIVGKDRKRYKLLGSDDRDQMRTDLWQKACRQWAQEHADAVAQALASAKTTKVREKYAWLGKYHNLEVKRFFGAKANPPLVKIS